ncbi:PREDICTED: bestrophin-2-like [Priapulus caudatus]|uniref:Bestrophin homolog n=1 Tax=Priapulus caudatus TaxID=37621 RepID=A0ABM1EFJ7_PRICU|nr:PREDICTED: bestrophin-2-like [Priapulus caudatus]
MTITYTSRVANVRFCGFSRLLFYWKGSIYKLVYKEMAGFALLYAFLSIMYRYALDGEYRRVFENIAIYCAKFTDLIPVSFILGFYVAIVVTRWWEQFVNIPWPDKIMQYVASNVHGTDERGRIIRRTLMRYCNTSAVMVYQAISMRVKKRFPTIDHLVEAGFLTENERKLMDDTPCPHGKWWFPCHWFSCLLSQAHAEGRIKDTYILKAIMDEMHLFRGNCGMLFSYDWVSVPLVYTQV